jgi:hypothetical protein
VDAVDDAQPELGAARARRGHRDSARDGHTHVRRRPRILRGHGLEPRVRLAQGLELPRWARLQRRRRRHGRHALAPLQREDETADQEHERDEQPEHAPSLRDPV